MLGLSRFRNLMIGFALCASLAPAAAGADEVQVPYWASLRAKPVNMRVGPGEDYRINWRYHREHLPLRVLRVMDGWRLVQDPDGARGWMLARFLKRERGAIVRAPGGSPAGWLGGMRDKPDARATLMWRVAPGVTGRLGECAGEWCEFDVDGHTGYIRADALWGDGLP